MMVSLLFGMAAMSTLYLMSVGRVSMNSCVLHEFNVGVSISRLIETLNTTQKAHSFHKHFISHFIVKCISFSKLLQFFLNIIECS